MKWAYGTRDRGSRHEYRWRRCPVCGCEDYQRPNFPFPSGGCSHCGWPQKQASRETLAALGVPAETLRSRQ